MRAPASRERQIARLRWYESRGFRVAFLLLSAVPLVLTVIGVMNLSAAGSQAKLAGSSLSGALKLWLNGPIPEATYPGHLVLALQNVEEAVFQFSEVPIALGVLFALR